MKDCGCSSCTHIRSRQFTATCSCGAEYQEWIEHPKGACTPCKRAASLQRLKGRGRPPYGRIRETIEREHDEEEGPRGFDVSL